jgi:hypothetical protein
MVDAYFGDDETGVTIPYQSVANLHFRHASTPEWMDRKRKNQVKTRKTAKRLSGQTNRAQAAPKKVALTIVPTEWINVVPRNCEIKEFLGQASRL